MNRFLIFIFCYVFWSSVHISETGSTDSVKLSDNENQPQMSSSISEYTITRCIPPIEPLITIIINVLYVSFLVFSLWCFYKMCLLVLKLLCASRPYQALMTWIKGPEDIGVLSHKNSDKAEQGMMLDTRDQKRGSESYEEGFSPIARSSMEGAQNNHRHAWRARLSIPEKDSGHVSKTTAKEAEVSEWQ